jgi:predicted  nucleic acid-binding Zn-ribbon protein
MMTEKTTDKLLSVIDTLIERVKDNADNINRLAEKIKELQEKQKDV